MPLQVLEPKIGALCCARAQLGPRREEQRKGDGGERRGVYFVNSVGVPCRCPCTTGHLWRLRPEGHLYYKRLNQGQVGH